MFLPPFDEHSVTVSFYPRYVQNFSEIVLQIGSMVQQMSSCNLIKIIENLPIVLHAINQSILQIPCFMLVMNFIIVLVVAVVIAIIAYEDNFEQ